ncbi:MAG: lipopolysaccharide heptosyltransferase II [Candidatus Coatesbacteria bacterium]|nr:lipopolysaccharide heptosyltransferase II [Candidatus Coatesbacteria bacterium]
MRILVRATNWVGDAVMNLPALGVIIKEHPGDEVHVVAKPWVAPIFSAFPGVAGVMPYSGKLKGVADSEGLSFGKAIKRIRELGFQKAYLFQNAFEAALLSYLGRIPERIGYARDCRRLLLTAPIAVTEEVRQLHHVNYYLHMLEEAGLDTSDPGIPTLVLREEVLDRASRTITNALGDIGSNGYLAVCPGAAFGPAKRWFPERFAEVIDYAWSKHALPSILLGSQSEKVITSRIAALASAKCVDLAGDTTLLEVGGILSQSRVVLSNDSGLMHLAAAVGPPVIAIFGSTNPTATGPLGEKHIILKSDSDCAPCLERECKKGSYECLDSITVGMVVEALDEAIGAHRK